MLSLHVFLVDTGCMLTFDMEMALDSVSRLMTAIAKATHIAVEKQVLLISSGEPLSPTSRVASYPTVGTEVNPIFLFSKSTIESNVPPSPSLNFGSEVLPKDKVERSLKMAPTYETVVSRDNLAAEFHRQALEFTQTANDLVNAQKLQEKGWAAVVANLESIVTPFVSHLAKLRSTYNDFIAARPEYETMLGDFESVISLLRRIPILPCLDSSMYNVMPPKSLLDWISVQDKRFSVMALVDHCSSLVKNFNDSNLSNVLTDMDKVEAQIDEGSSGMREIRGLSERLKSLEDRLTLMQKLLQDQEVMAQGFHQNRLRAQHLGDASVLPDLCASHQKQLVVMLKNHQKIREIYKVCVGSQDELSANLHKRLRWIMYIEKLICESDNKVLIYFENLQRIKKRLEVIEQVYEAPRMYVLAMLEVLRRKNFSSQFLEWGRNVSQSANSTRNQEVEQRSKFGHVFGNHFLQSLFPGLDDTPQPFVDNPPQLFDSRLPDVGIDDLRLLQDNVPELLTELSLGDCFDQSIYVQDRLSQSHLSKLVDPKQNPTLEETLEFRKKANVDQDSKLTVSQLQREISCDKVDVDLSENLLHWQIGSDSADSPSDEDFHPHSLGALPERIVTRQLIGSSSSSEGSDSMYKSANAGVEPDESLVSVMIEDHVDNKQVGPGTSELNVERPDDSSVESLPGDPQDGLIRSGDDTVTRPIASTLLLGMLDILKGCKESSNICSNEILQLRQCVKSYVEQCQSCLRDMETTAVVASQEMIALRGRNSALSSEVTAVKEAHRIDLETRDTKALNEDAKNTMLAAENSGLQQRIDELQSNEKLHLSEIDKLNTDKLQLESDQQGRFNAALCKLKKDKETTVKQLTTINEELQGRLAEMQTDNVGLLTKLSNAEEQRQGNEQKMKHEIDGLTAKLELMVECHSSEVDRLQRQLDSTPQMERLMPTSMAESVEIVHHQATTKTTASREVSVEEAVDALEWERVQDKLKAIQDENRQLKDLHNVSDDSLKNQMIHARLLLREKEEQCKSLHRQLADAQKPKIGFSQFNATNENITTRTPDKQEIVSLLYDPLLKSCIVFCLDDMKHFLHPESLAELPFKTDLETGKIKCFLGRITDKEYCFTKKPQNHLKLPVGTYFCRVKVTPIL